MPPGHRRRRDPDRLRRGRRAQADTARARAGRAVLSGDAATRWDGGPVWYAAYGSNLDADRFRCYLRGGCPPGATRTYPGAREPGDPLDVRPFTMPGRLAFAWESPTWGGGIAFHQADAEGTTLARAYLVTVRQFADVLEQEMRRDPGADHDLAPVLAARRHAVGPGRYETLQLVGELDDRPVLTFSTPDVAALGLRPPAPAYLATLARGLRAAHDLSLAETVDYLVTCPGIAGHWGPDALTDLLAPLLRTP